MKKTGFILATIILLSSLSAFAAPIPAQVFIDASETDAYETQAELTGELSSEPTGTLLTGTEIYGGEFNSSGEDAKWNNSNNTDQLFMKTSNEQDVYVGYQLEKPMIITQAEIYPDVRTSDSQVASAWRRIKNATVEVSNDGENWEIVGTVGSKEEAIINQKKGLPFTFNFVDTIWGKNEYSYVRFCMRKGVAADTYFSFSEVKFYGVEKSVQKLVSDDIIESDNRYVAAGHTANWYDGSYSTGTGTERVFFDNTTDAYAGFDYGAHKVVPTKVQIVPAVDANSYKRINKAEIQGRTETGEWETLLVPDYSNYTETQLTTIEFDLNTDGKEYTALRLFRGACNQDYLSFVDLSFYGYFTCETEKLTGDQIFSHDPNGTYYNNTKAPNVFDGNVDSYLMINTPGVDDTYDIWAGYDFGEGKAVIITDVGYYGYDAPNDDHTPRRVQGQIFQGSNDKEKWTDLAVIKTGTQGQYTYFDVFDSTPYRYVRLYDKNGAKDTSLDVGSYYMQAEIEFYGHYAEEYTVSFVGGVGSTQTNPVTLIEQSTLDVSQFKFDNTDDYEFIGWADEDGIIVTGEIVVTKDITLTAQWKYIGIAPLSFKENSIRVTTPDGIRFKSAVTNVVKSDEKTTEYGYIVTLESLVGSYNAEDVLKFDNGIINYVYGTNYGYDSDIGANVDRIYAQDSDFTYFTAVIYGVKQTKEALSEKIIVRPYIKYNGEIIYGSPMSRSVLDVATAIRDSGYVSVDEYGKQYVQNILKICGEAI